MPLATEEQIREKVEQYKLANPGINQPRKAIPGAIYSPKIEPIDTRPVVSDQRPNQFTSDFAESIQPVVLEELPTIRQFSLTEDEIAQAERQGKRDYLDVVTDGNALPFSDLWDTLPELYQVHSAMKRVNADYVFGDDMEYKEKVIGELKQDVKVVDDYIHNLLMNQARGTSFTGYLGHAHIEIPKFIVEIAIAGGITKLAEYGARKSTVKFLQQVAEKSAQEGVKGALLRTTTRGMAYTGVGALTGSTQSAYYERRIMSNFKWSRHGAELIKEAQETPAISLMKVLGSRFIEGWSEGTGPILRAGTGKIASKLTPRLYKAFFTAHAETFGQKVTKKVFVELGFDGLLEELGEERVAALLYAMTNMDLAPGEKLTAGDVWKRVGRSIFPELDQLLLETLTIAPIAGGAKATQLAIDRITANKKAADPDYTGDPEFKELTREEIREIIAKTEAKRASEIEGIEKEAKASQANMQEEQDSDFLAPRSEMPMRGDPVPTEEEFNEMAAKGKTVGAGDIGGVGPEHQNKEMLKMYLGMYETWYERGKYEGYSDEDIAHFYKKNSQNPYEEYVADSKRAARKQGRGVFPPVRKDAVDAKGDAAMLSAEESLDEPGLPDEVVAELEEAGLDAMAIDDSVEQAEALIEEGEPTSAAYRASFGDEVSDQTIAKLAAISDEAAVADILPEPAAPEQGVRIKFPGTGEEIVLNGEDFSDLDMFNQFYSEFKSQNKRDPRWVDAAIAIEGNQSSAMQDKLERLANFGLIQRREVKNTVDDFPATITVYSPYKYTELGDAPVEYVPTNEELVAAREAVARGIEGVELPNTIFYDEAKQIWLDELRPIEAFEDFAKGRLLPFADKSMADEYKALPRKYKGSRRNPRAVDPDTFAEEAKRAGLVAESFTGKDVIESLLLMSDKANRPQIEQFFDDAIANSREQLARYTRYQAGLKSAIIASQNIKRAADQKTVTEYQALVSKIGAMSRAAREATAFTKKQIMETQKGMRAVLDKLDLEPAQMDRFTNRILNTNTPEQAQRILPDMLDRAKELLTNAKRARLFAAINKELRGVKPKAPRGKPKGKFTVEYQRSLTAMRNASRLSMVEAADKLAANIAEYTTPDSYIPPPEVAHENMVLDAVADRKNVSIQRLGEILETVKALKAGGKAAAKLKANKNLIEQDDIAESVTAIIESAAKDPNLPITYHRVVPGEKMNRGLAWYTNATAWTMGWQNKLNRLSWGDKKTGTNKSAINEYGDVFKQEEQEYRLNNRDRVLHERAWKDSYGEMTPREIEKKLTKDSIVNKIGNFVNARGNMVPLWMSKQEIIDFYMKTKDESLKDVIYSPDVMGFTEEMVEALLIELDEFDIRYAENLMGFYGPKYDEFNPVYSEKQGVDSPKIKNYSPLQREPLVFEKEEREKRKKAAEEAAKEEAEKLGLTEDGFRPAPPKERYAGFELMDEMAFRVSIMPSAGYLRTPNNMAIKPQSATEAYFRHTQQVNHFIVWADKIQQLRNLFNDGRVAHAIKSTFGGAIYKQLVDDIRDFTRGSIDRSHDWAFVLWLKNNYVVSQLALKGYIGAKQLTSFFAFADEIPIDDFIEGLVDLGSDTMDKVKLMSQSEVLIARRKGFSPELAESLRPVEMEFKKFGASPTMKRTLTLMTRAGDRGAIYIGGWPVYRYYRTKLRKSHAEAMEAFERAFESSQQSPSLSRQAHLQKQRDFVRMTMNFKSAQLMYFQKSMATVDDFIAGRISAKEAAKKLTIYIVILPTMFEIVADGFKITPKRIVRAMATTSALGLPFIGEFWTYAISKMLKLPYWSSTVMGSLFNEFVQALKTLWGDDDGEFTVYDVLKAIKEWGELGGLVTGFPTKYGFNLIEAVRRMTHGEVLDGFQIIAGMSPYVLDQNKDPKSKEGMLNALPPPPGMGKAKDPWKKSKKREKIPGL